MPPAPDPTPPTNAEVDALNANDFGTWDCLTFLNDSLHSPTPDAAPATQTPPCRTWLREPFCGASHLLGALASLIACAVLLHRTAGQPTHVIAAVALYGAGLVAVYLASGLYHSLHTTPDGLALLRRLDLSAIFLLIAGTFAPLCLITLNGPLGWALLAAEYTLALTGITLVLFRLPFPDWLRVGTYLLMGWLSVLVLKPLQATLPPAGVAWYIAGGLLYTLGTVIYATDRPHLLPGRFTAHDLWHVFVLGGSLCHFVLIYRYVLAPLLTA